MTPSESLRSQAASLRRMASELEATADELDDQSPADITTYIPRPHRTQVQRVLDAVSQDTGVLKSVMLSSNRSDYVVGARWVAMYLLHERTPLNIPTIGTVLNRNHSTIVYGLRNIRRLLASGDPATTAVVRRIEAKLDALEQTA